MNHVFEEIYCTPSSHSLTEKNEEICYLRQLQRNAEVAKKTDILNILCSTVSLSVSVFSTSRRCRTRICREAIASKVKKSTDKLNLLPKFTGDFRMFIVELLRQPTTY